MGATRTQRLVESISRQVFSFELKPGQRLTETGLARTHNVSRTPVREALKTLHEMGLIDQAPGGGYAVRIMDLQTVSDLIMIRASLEDLAIQLAVRNNGTSVFAELLEQSQNSADTSQIVAGRFHSDLANLSKNRELERLLDSIYLRTEPYRRLDGSNRDEEVHSDHLRLLEMLRDGEVDAARSLMSNHIDKTHDLIRALMRGGVQALSFEPS